jgi:lactoylglutathione lyase
VELRIDRREFLLGAAGSVAVALCPWTAGCQSDGTKLPGTRGGEAIIDIAESRGRNLESVASVFEAWNKGAVNEALGAFEPAIQLNGSPASRDDLARGYEDLFRCFPDLRFGERETVAADDSVVVRVICSGTHGGKGDYLLGGGALAGVPATGNQVSFQQIHWFKLRGSKVFDLRSCRDDVAMLRQLGLFPARPAGGPPPEDPPVAHRNVSNTREQETNLAAFWVNRHAERSRNLEATVAGFAPDTRNHGRPVGREGVRRVLSDIFSTLAPAGEDESALRTLAVDDCVVALFVQSNTHVGVSQGFAAGGSLAGIAASGRTFTRQEIHWFTYRSGLIVEHRACRDDLAMLRTLRVPIVQRN